MIALLQRVSRASVTVAGDCIGQIDEGLLALIGIEKEDSVVEVQRLLQRMLNYRVFADDNGKMNRSLRDISGGLLLVPQFTLVADTDRGNRPSFSRGAEPDKGADLFNQLLTSANAEYSNVAAGRFAADMKVELVNEGPVTFWLQV